MGLCTYTLAKLCNSSTSSPYYFNVEAKNEHRGDPKVSFVKHVLIEVYGQKVKIEKNEKDRVLVSMNIYLFPIWCFPEVFTTNSLLTFLSYI